MKHSAENGFGAQHLQITLQHHEVLFVMKRVYSALVILAFIFIIACVNKPYIVGKWKELGKTGMLELWKDGKFKAVDSQKMVVSGVYTLSEHGNIRFEIFRQGYPSEIINVKYSICGDMLTFTSSDGKEIERYEREK